MSNKKKVRPQYVAKANRKKEPMPKKLKIGLWAGSGILVLGLLLFLILYDDGSLSVRDNVIVDKQDNWIISKLAVARGEKYYKLGEISSALEGFEIDPTVSIKSDENESTFWYTPKNEDCQVEYYYITGVSSSISEMVEFLPQQLAIFSPDSVVGEVKTAVVAAREASYFLVSNPAPVDEEAAETENTDETETTEGTDETETTETTDEVEETEEHSHSDHASQQIICYVPSTRNSCILISAALIVNEEMPEWTQEQLLELVQSIGEKLVIEK